MELNKIPKFWECFEVVKLRKLKPQFVIRGFDGGVKPDDFKNVLFAKNHAINDNNLNTDFPFRTFVGINLVLSVHSEIYKILKDIIFVFFGWQKLRSSFLSIHKCSNCGQFGHIAKFCNTQKCCYKCGGTDDTNFKTLR